MGTVSFIRNGVNVAGARVYNADLPAAKQYLAAAIGAGPDAWNASTDDNIKAWCLVAAKRYIDAKTWQGTKTDPAQLDEWPRTGVTDKYGTAVDPAVVPVQFAQAEAELAAIFMADPTVNAAVSSGSNVKTISAARGVDIEFFRPTDTPSQSTPMPLVVQRLIGQFTSVSGLSGVNQAFNTSDGDFDDCVPSSFDDCAMYKRNGPLG